MKKIMLIAILGVVLQFVAAAQKTGGHGREDKRQKAQRGRIHEGVKDGEITRGEQVALNAQQRKVQRLERKFNADGVVTPAEKLKLERAQDKANRRIHRAKTNAVGVDQNG